MNNYISKRQIQNNPNSIKNEVTTLLISHLSDSHNMGKHGLTYR